MQTIEQLLSKILDLIAEAEQRGEKPDLVLLTPDDEHTLAVHLWLRSEAADSEALAKTPPDVRNFSKGYTKLAGLSIQWDAEKTQVRARTPEERTAYRERLAHSSRQMAEVNRRLAEDSRRQRTRLWGG